MKVLVGIAAVLLGLLASAPGADGAVICRKKSGVLVSREACSKREAAVDLAQVGVLGPTGPEGPGGPAGGALIKDANGQLVGYWLVMPNNLGAGDPGVVRDVGGTVAFIRADTSGFVLSGSLYYTSADCSGTPYAVGIPGMLVPSAAVGSATAYVPTGTPTMRTLNSSASFMSMSACTMAVGTFLPPDRCCFPVSYMLDTLSVQAVDLTPLGFVPPFHAELP